MALFVGLSPAPLQSPRYSPDPLNIKVAPDAVRLTSLNLAFLRLAPPACCCSFNPRMASSASGSLTPAAVASMSHPRSVSNVVGGESAVEGDRVRSHCALPLLIIIAWPHFLETFCNFLEGGKEMLNYVIAEISRVDMNKVAIFAPWAIAD